MMRKKETSAAVGLLFWLAVSGTITPTAAEPPARPPEAPAPSVASIDDLPDLVGHWRGEGWMVRGPGEPHRFVGQETVWSELDGEILLVRGEHRTPDGERLVHHAFAMLNPAPDGDGYRFRTYLAGGRQGDFPAHLDDGAIVWTMETAAGPVRYVIRIDGDTWHEVGERRQDGAWSQFFEMTLQRVSR